MVLKMKHEPKLNAGVRNSDGYLMAPCQVERSRKLEMLVHVEYTPNLVIAAASSAFLIPYLLPLILDRSGNKRDRRTPERINRDESILPKPSRPVHDVALLGP
jgi:hypothetical protein